jgi:hypothetical protein
MVILKCWLMVVMYEDARTKGRCVFTHSRVPWLARTTALF